MKWIDHRSGEKHVPLPGAGCAATSDEGRNDVRPEYSTLLSGSMIERYVLSSKPFPSTVTMLRKGPEVCLEGRVIIEVGSQRIGYRIPGGITLPSRSGYRR